jgi:hypothetical protein
MKKVYLLLFVCVLCFKNSEAQSYTPFMIQNSHWVSLNAFCDMGQSYSTFFEDWTEEDTLINGTIHTKLYERYRMGITDCGNIFSFWSSGGPYAPTLIGYLRQDTISKTVFLLKKDSVAESLLYDFGLSLGDTIYSPEINSYGAIVRSVDSLIHGTNVYRKLNFSLCDSTTQSWYYSFSWIEGLGSSAGFLNPFNDSHFSWNELLCFTNNNEIIYTSWRGAQGCSITQIGEVARSKFFLNISPNPSTTYFTLQLSSLPSTPTYFQLFDALGRQVKQEEIVSETTTIHRGSLPTGIYFWQLQQSNKIVERGKLVME